MVAKTAYLKQEDMEKVRGYEGEVTGYNKRLQQANAKAEEALDKTQKKEQEITEKGKKLKTLQAELQEKNSTDLTEVASWSVSEKWKLLRYFSKSFDKTSPYEIDCVDKWTNGHCEWKDIIETRTQSYRNNRRRVHERNLCKRIYPVAEEKEVCDRDRIAQSADQGSGKASMVSPTTLV